MEVGRLTAGLGATGGGDLERLGCGLVIFFPVDIADVDRWAGVIALLGLDLLEGGDDAPSI